MVRCELKALLHRFPNRWKQIRMHTFSNRKTQSPSPTPPSEKRGETVQWNRNMNDTICLFVCKIYIVYKACHTLAINGKLLGIVLYATRVSCSCMVVPFCTYLHFFRDLGLPHFFMYFAPNFPIYFYIPNHFLHVYIRTIHNTVSLYVCMCAPPLTASSGHVQHRSKEKNQPKFNGKSFLFFRVTKIVFPK